MKLYIAEKPSLARAIVEVLPKPHKKKMDISKQVMAIKLLGVSVIY